MKMTKKFKISLWKEAEQIQAKAFWEKRGVVFSENTLNRLSGKRGTLLGNICSFQMPHVMTQVTVQKEPGNQVVCELKINSFLQIITSWNKAYLQLELDTFESELLGKGSMDSEWIQMKKRTRRNDWIWIGIAAIIGGILGVLMILFNGGM